MAATDFLVNDTEDATSWELELDEIERNLDENGWDVAELIQRSRRLCKGRTFGSDAALRAKAYRCLLGISADDISSASKALESEIVAMRDAAVEMAATSTDTDPVVGGDEVDTLDEDSTAPLSQRANAAELKRRRDAARTVAEQWGLTDRQTRQMRAAVSVFCQRRASAGSVKWSKSLLLEVMASTFMTAGMEPAVTLAALEHTVGPWVPEPLYAPSDSDRHRAMARMVNVQFTFLLQYLDPALSHILATVRVDFLDFAWSWLTSLFAGAIVVGGSSGGAEGSSSESPSSTGVVHTLWDRYLTEGNPLMIFFMAAVILANSSEECQAIYNREYTHGPDGSSTNEKATKTRQALIAVLSSAPTQLSAEDVGDFIDFAKLYARAVPLAFCHQWRRSVFESDATQAPGTGTLLQMKSVACMTHPSEVWGAVGKGQGLNYVVLRLMNTRSGQQFASDKGTAVMPEGILDTSKIVAIDVQKCVFDDPSALDTLITDRMSASLDPETPSPGKPHICIMDNDFGSVSGGSVTSAMMDSGSEDMAVATVVSRLLARNIPNVSVGAGGFPALLAVSRGQRPTLVRPAQPQASGSSMGAKSWLGGMKGLNLGETTSKFADSLKGSTAGAMAMFGSKGSRTSESSTSPTTGTAATVVPSGKSGDDTKSQDQRRSSIGFGSFFGSKAVEEKAGTGASAAPAKSSGIEQQTQSNGGDQAQQTSQSGTDSTGSTAQFSMTSFKGFGMAMKEGLTKGLKQAQHEVAQVNQALFTPLAPAVPSDKGARSISEDAGAATLPTDHTARGRNFGDDADSGPKSEDPNSGHKTSPERQSKAAAGADIFAIGDEEEEDEGRASQPEPQGLQRSSSNEGSKRGSTASATGSTTASNALDPTEMIDVEGFLASLPTKGAGEVRRVFGCDRAMRDGVTGSIFPRPSLLVLTERQLRFVSVASHERNRSGIPDPHVIRLNDVKRITANKKNRHRLTFFIRDDRSPTQQRKEMLIVPEVHEVIAAVKEQVTIYNTEGLAASESSPVKQ
eukprot:Clim_evm12s201 gene=Clim_evmTU12s201